MKPDDTAPSTGFTPHFGLYAGGISIWMVLVSCIGSTYMLPLLPAETNAALYVVPQQATYVACYFIVAFVEWRRGPFGFFTFERITISCFIVSALCIAMVALGIRPDALLVVSGLAVGLGIALGFMQWLRIVVERPTREIEVLLFVASAASIVSGIAFCFMPFAARFALFALVLVPASAILLHLNTKRSANALAHKPTERGPIGVKRLARTLTVPTVCAVVLVLVAPIASTTYIDTADQELFRLILAQIANLVALVILAIVYFALNKKVRIFNAYCMLFPVLASSVLVASFFEPSQRWFVLFLGDVCFCTVSFLMLLTSCAISKKLHVSTNIVYGLLGGFVYLARTPEALLVISPAQPPDTLAPFAIAALLLYVLTIPTFFLPFVRRQAGRDRAYIVSSFTAADLSNACDRLADRHALPQRQREVLKMLVGGHSAPHIAEVLCLSQNTVKTYRKAIYASLGVHSKQELIDLALEERKRLDPSAR